MGPKLLAKRASSKAKVVTDEEAEEYIERFFEKFPGVSGYCENMREQGRTRGYVLTLLGRRRYLEGFHSTDRTIRGEAERAAVNTPIQGTAGDVLRPVMARLAFDNELRNNDIRVRLQVHDELLVTVPKGVDPKLISRIEEEMAHPFENDLSVPLVAKGHIGKNWAEAH